MSDKVKGSIYGIASAISYGLNPLGGLRLGEEGVNTHTILFSRFSLAVILMALFIALKAVKGNPSSIFSRLKHGFLLSHCVTLRTPRRSGSKASCLTHSALALILVLGILFAVSALSLYLSYLHMDSGIASTLLFVYPIIVALIMAVFFHERITIVTILSLTLALCGIGLLNDSSSDQGINAAGCALVMTSALAYALYIVLLNRWRVKVPVFTLNLYVMIVCAVTIALHASFTPGEHLMMLPSARAFGYAIMLAVVPTVISLITMTRSIELIGSTPTAIMGAFEPLTAVVVGIVVFHEAFTARIAMGNTLIVIAVIAIISNRYIMALIRYLTKAITSPMLNHSRNQQQKH